MNFKRKTCRRQVKCCLCTPVRWFGNRKGRRKHREDAERKRLEAEANYSEAPNS